MTVATSRPTNSGAVRRQRAGSSRARASCRQAAGDGERRNDEQEPAEQHREAEVRSYQGVLTRDAGKRAAVVSGRARVGVEHSLKPCGRALLKFAIAGPGGFQ